jgi:hypothetical protein
MTECPFDNREYPAEFSAWHAGWRAGCAAVNAAWERAFDRHSAASGIETEGQDPQGLGAEHESATAESGDAQTTPSKGK